MRILFLLLVVSLAASSFFHITPDVSASNGVRPLEPSVLSPIPNMPIMPPSEPNIRRIGRGNILPLSGPCLALFFAWYYMIEETYLGPTLVSRKFIILYGLLEQLIDGVWKPLLPLEGFKWNAQTERYESSNLELYPGGNYNFRFNIQKPFTHVSDPRPVEVKPCPTAIEVKTVPTVCGTKQVLIEARIVEVPREFLRELGVRFDLSGPDGSVTFEAKTNENGEASVSAPFPRAGSYLLKVSYTPENPEQYQASSTEKRFTVEKSQPTILLDQPKSVDGGPPRYGEWSMVSGVVEDQFSTVITLKEVNLKFMKKGAAQPAGEVKVRTDENGRFTATYQFPAASFFQLIGLSGAEEWVLDASLAENICYTPSSASLGFTLQPQSLGFSWVASYWPYLLLVVVLASLSLGYGLNYMTRHLFLIWGGGKPQSPCGTACTCGGKDCNLAGTHCPTCGNDCSGTCTVLNLPDGSRHEGPHICSHGHPFHQR